MEELKNNPGKKMRNLLAGGKSSPLTRLPKKPNSFASLPLKEGKKSGTPTKLKAAAPSKDIPLKNETPQSTIKIASPSKGLKLNFWSPFWTIASALSLTVNLILITLLLAIWLNPPSIKTEGLMKMGDNLLGGLYSNFQKMDRAHITTTIPVETTVPVKFDLQLNQQTDVVLSRSVTINNARVTVNTGGLNITNALTTIVLPQGTILPITLKLTVPVDQTVPVVINVNVDIPLEKTQLHEPFSGLQEVIKPLYCMINPNATNLDQKPICK
jgi:hypothetical protein